MAAGDAEAAKGANPELAAGVAAGQAEEQCMPRDAHVVLSVLKSMGVEECDDRVVHQLLEFMYRYVGEVLGDASAYAGHADRSTLELDDVKLAMQARVNFAFAQPPPREVQLELSSARNRVPLPGLGAAKVSGESAKSEKEGLRFFLSSQSVYLSHPSFALQIESGRALLEELALLPRQRQIRPCPMMKNITLDDESDRAFAWRGPRVLRGPPVRHAETTRHLSEDTTPHVDGALCSVWAHD